MLAFSPLFRADFTTWDERYNIVENPNLNPPTWVGVARYWRAPAFDLYVPVTYTLWAGIARVAFVPASGMSPAHLNPNLFHAANVLIHLGSALLVFQILLVLFRAWPGVAVLGALVFALHPIQVEAVGWVAGFKDVLSGCLALAALTLYLSEHRKQLSFVAATILFGLAMLSKPSAMVLPLIAVVIDIGFQRRSTRQTILRMLIWAPLAIACAVIAKFLQPATVVLAPAPLFARPLVASDAICFYLYKLIWPFNLGIDYGRSPSAILANHWTWMSWIVPVSLAAILLAARNRFRAGLTGALVFVIAPLPVLGLVTFDFQMFSTVADHYTYLAMLGVSIFFAAIGAVWRGRSAIALWSVLLALLALRSWDQSWNWIDSKSLFGHAITVNPRSWMAHNNLAVALIDAHEYLPASEAARGALAINSNFVPAHRNLAKALQLQGDLNGALAAMTNAAGCAPDDPVVWTELGHLLSSAGKSAEAHAAYEQARRLEPRNAMYIVNVASSLAEMGRLDEAIQMYQAALRIDRILAEAQEGLALAQKAKSATQPLSPSPPGRGPG